MIEELAMRLAAGFLKTRTQAVIAAVLLLAFVLTIARGIAG